VLITPLILLAERYGEARGRFTYGVSTSVLGAGLLLSLVRGGFSWRFGFFAIMGPTSAVLIAQVVPLPPHGDSADGAPERSWLAASLVTLAQVIASVGLVLSFGYKDIDPKRPDGGHDPRAVVPFLVLCLGFYVQGYFSQRWSTGQCWSTARPPTWVGLYRLGVAYLLQLVLMVSSPLGDVESGHFIYPIYSTTYKHGPEFGAVHVLGTWCYIGVFVSLFQAYGNDIVSKPFFKHATGSTVVVYIFHWVFVKVFAFWMLNPTLHRTNTDVRNVWTAVGMTVVALLFSVGCSLSVYGLLLCCPPLGRIFGL